MGAVQDRLDRALVGTVLVRCPVAPDIDPGLRPWQAGRVHLDGIHWEEKTWPREDFIAFRDHVAHLLEAPSRLEQLEWRHANAMTLIRDTRQEQVDPDSQEFADLETVIDGFMTVAASIQEEVTTLKSSPPEMVTAAR